MNLPRQIIIPQKDAVFWLDTNGRWHNRSGVFKHKKIIDYFHASIQKDKNGYYLYQSYGNCMEKVYFNYEDTALFVFDIILENDNIILMLNTRKKIKLQPRNLFIKGDNLYLRTDDNDRIKFAERALTQISKYIDYEDDHYFLMVSEDRFLIGTE